MSWVVVEIAADSSMPNPEPVTVHGLYASRDEAEQARRRIHLDNRLVAGSAWVSIPKTYVCEVK